MQQTSLPRYIQYLLRPASYPCRVDKVDLVQTHVSYLLFAGDFVYKWKKPVNLGFLDFSTLERRRHYCEEEVRLNRRLCPEMYLGVVRLSADDEAFVFDGDGETVEYGVKMVRLPVAAMMDRRIGCGRLHWADLARVVERLATFYRGIEVMTPESGYGNLPAIRRTINDNFAETRPFIGGPALSERCFSRIRRYTEHVLIRETLFAERLAGGYVRDCHGDLHTANICLTEKLEIFDCIEFNAGLRCTDIAADIAFLAMDLDFHGLPELGRQFVSAFVAESGDDVLLELLDFYKCYRAYVRGKIGLLTAADPGVDRSTAKSALAAAKRYFRLAEQYALAGS